MAKLLVSGSVVLSNGATYNSLISALEPTCFFQTVLKNSFSETTNGSLGFLEKNANAQL